MAACSKGEEELPLRTPVITLDNPLAIYPLKSGEKLTIHPTYGYTDDRTLYRWTLNGKVIGRDSLLQFSSEGVAVGRYYVTLSVTNPRGTSDKELRIDVLALDPPQVTLPGSEEGLHILQHSELTLTPQITSSLASTCRWWIGEQPISDQPTLTLPTQTIGQYRVRLVVQNDDGQVELKFDVEVCSPDKVDFGWTFLTDEYHVALGRTIRLRPVDIHNAFEAYYTWSVDGVQVQQSSDSQLRFEASREGTFVVKVEMQNQYLRASHSLRVVVCPAEGAYRRAVGAASKPQANKVYEFLPAPGQFVNEHYTVTTMAEACTYALSRMTQTAYVSLGGFGGYMVVGFDHSIANDGGYDIAVTGNAFDGSSEPGVVWVMQDENGDGMPNDTWYELKGSEYGKQSTWVDYAVTYYRPKAPRMAVAWSDNHAQSGSVDYLGAFHTQDFYYPLWAAADSYTLRGTRLEARNHDISGNGTYWVNESYEWGYADNFSAIDRLSTDDNHDAAPADNHFRIADAVTFEGQPAKLAYVDFVKIQVATHAKSGWLGENSTEVFGVKDFNMSK